MRIERWEIDSSRSRILFAVRHLVFSKTRGRFSRLNGNVMVPDGDLSRATVALTLMNACTLFGWWGLNTCVPAYLVLPTDQGGGLLTNGLGKQSPPAAVRGLPDPRTTGTPLLVPQRHDRIQPRRAPGGPDTEHHADDGREHERRRDCRW